MSEPKRWTVSVKGSGPSFDPKSYEQVEAIIRGVAALDDLVQRAWSLIADAEAAVQAAYERGVREGRSMVDLAAADTRTREIVEWLGTREATGRLLAPAMDAGEALASIADAIARRFPVSDCEGDTDGTA